MVEEVNVFAFLPLEERCEGSSAEGDTRRKGRQRRDAENVPRDVKPTSDVIQFTMGGSLLRSRVCLCVCKQCVYELQRFGVAHFVGGGTFV